MHAHLRGRHRRRRDTGRLRDAGRRLRRDWAWRSPGSCAASRSARSSCRPRPRPIPRPMALAEIPAVLDPRRARGLRRAGGRRLRRRLLGPLAGPAVGRGRCATHAYRAMAPVWEANHVWLIFVLVVVWTAYPTAFGSIASTLVRPAARRRGRHHPARDGLRPAQRRRRRSRDRGRDGLVFSRLVDPHSVRARRGDRRRSPPGAFRSATPQGDLVTSWLNPTSILVGALAVATAAYLAAVYLAADAAREGKPGARRAFRARALAAGVVAGALAAGRPGRAARRTHGRCSTGSPSGAGLAAVLVSGAAGLGTLGSGARRALRARARLRRARGRRDRRRLGHSRQRPDLLPGLSIEEAAAGRPTLWALLIVDRRPGS